MFPPHIPGLNLNEELACIFTDRGELLWRSPAWTGGKRDWKKEHAVLGTRWKEFVFEEDLPALMRWFGDGRENGTEFRAMAPSSGQHVRIRYRKIGWEGHWIVLGAATPTDERPAPPSIMLGTILALGCSAAQHSDLTF